MISRPINPVTRIIDSIKGFLIGVVLFLLSIPLLFWNEGRAVHRAQDLEAGSGAVVEGSADAVDASQEGKLVHLTGTVASTETLTDPLGPTAPGAIRLRRTVQMYQWKENSRTENNRRIYTYNQEWSDHFIDASQFEEAGHYNPPMPFASESWDVSAATVGARQLTPALIRQVDGFQPLPVTAASAPGVTQLGRPVQPTPEGLYLGANSAAPQVGDVKVKWEAAPSAAVTLLAAQTGSTFGDWNAPTGNVLEANLRMGTLTSAQMFTTLQAENETLTWVLRGVGFFLSFIGLLLVFQPLVAVADMLPLVGSLVGAGSFLVALAVSVPVSLLVISIGWIVYRPLLGILLLVVALGVMGGVGFLAVRIGKSKNEERAAARRAQATG